MNLHLCITRFINLILVLIPIGAMAQDDNRVEQLPTNFSQFSNIYSYVNPASIGQFNRFELEMASQFASNNLGNFNVAYTHFNMRLNELDQGGKQQVGVSFYNDQEGVFLTRTRGYLMYAIHIPVGDSLFLAGGLGAGGMNYTVKATQLTPGSSDFAPDLNGGVWLYGNSYHFGLSVNQVLNSEVQPFQEITKLTRHFHLNAGKSFEFNGHVDLFSDFMVRYAPGFRTDANLHLRGVIRKRFNIGATYRYGDVISPTVGIQQIQLGPGALASHIAYNIPFDRFIPPGLRTFELSINYTID